MMNASKFLTLHRYFLQASLSRKLFRDELNNGRAKEPAAFVYLLLWYGCLYVVVEGYKEEGIKDASVDGFLADAIRLDLLRRCRNCVFHYQNNYIDARVEAVLHEANFVAWINGLYDALSAFFLAKEIQE